MNQGDRVWYYELGPRGPVRRLAVAVSDPEETNDALRVNLAVYSRCPMDKNRRGGAVFQEIMVPVRDSYTPGGPVDTPFCVAMEAKPARPSVESVIRKPLATAKARS